eukprot:9813429-Karenia_brevis.AAC.1
MRRRWHAIYKGNVDDHFATIWRYLFKYSPFIYRASPHNLANISGQDLFDAVDAAGDSAPGMDHWSYADLRLLPVSAFDVLASLLILVEMGSPWPTKLLKAKAHLL